MFPSNLLLTDQTISVCSLPTKSRKRLVYDVMTYSSATRHASLVRDLTDLVPVDKPDDDSTEKLLWVYRSSYSYRQRLWYVPSHTDCDMLLHTEIDMFLRRGHPFTSALTATAIIHPLSQRILSITPGSFTCTGQSSHLPSSFSHFRQSIWSKLNCRLHEKCHRKWHRT